MASFLARRLGVMLLTMLCLTLIVFYLVNLEPNLRKLAISQTEMHATDERARKLAGQERLSPAVLRPLRDLARRLAEGASPSIRRRARPIAALLLVRRTEDADASPACSRAIFGCSTKFKVKVVDKLGPALEATGILMFWVMALMIPVALADRDRLGHARGVAGRPRACR